MLSVSPSMIARSSLEEMLESIRRREEDVRPKDLPPKLPSRPNSKARRPLSKRQLPNNFANSSASFSCVKNDSSGGDFDAKKIGELEESRKQVLLAGTLKVQKCFRSYQVRRYFHELKRRAISLQSFIRAANARRKYDNLINQREQVVQKKRDEQERIVLQLQAVVRGWLARKQVKTLQNLEKMNKYKSGSCHSPSQRIFEVKEMSQASKQVLSLAVEELQMRVLKAETMLKKKEQENAALRSQVQQYEARWLEFEGKMKSMEDMWQKQTTSLQMSLAEVKRSVADYTSIQPKRQDDLPASRHYDSDYTNSPEAQTPSIRLTNSVREFGAGRQSNGNGNTLGDLMKEFEQRKYTFDDEVKAIIEVKSEHAVYANLDKDLRNLKTKFETWMKDYKARLRQAKSNLRKAGLSDAENCHRKWWGGISKRY
ncbi:myosin-2-like isoform X2 [Apium graveolens]|uniref:myosin-2-like isoform X2 n=1 Tax=Apium graveolens TaxID=4045 RepID=UPI003D7B35FA